MDDPIESEGSLGETNGSDAGVSDELSGDSDQIADDASEGMNPGGYRQEPSLVTLIE